MEEQTLEKKNQQVVDALRETFSPATLLLSYETEPATIFVLEPDEPE